MIGLLKRYVSYNALFSSRGKKLEERTTGGLVLVMGGMAGVSIALSYSTMFSTRGKTLTLE